jgi:hypothetical protein
MPTQYPSDFLTFRNFELAWERILRGTNLQYKRFFLHLFPSYQFGLPQILGDLIRRIAHGHFIPSSSTTVYLPKPTRVLRPIHSFLSMIKSSIRRYQITSLTSFTGNSRKIMVLRLSARDTPALVVSSSFSHGLAATRNLIQRSAMPT